MVAIASLPSSTVKTLSILELHSCTDNPGGLGQLFPVLLDLPVPI